MESNPKLSTEAWQDGWVEFPSWNLSDPACSSAGTSQQTRSQKDTDDPVKVAALTLMMSRSSGSCLQFAPSATYQLCLPKPLSEKRCPTSLCFFLSEQSSCWLVSKSFTTASVLFFFFPLLTSFCSKRFRYVARCSHQPERPTLWGSLFRRWCCAQLKNIRSGLDLTLEMPWKKKGKSST